MATIPGSRRSGLHREGHDSPAFFEARAVVMNERAAATRASAPSSSSTPHRGATAVRGGASEGDSGSAFLDKYEHAVREQPAREVRDV